MGAATSVSREKELGQCDAGEVGAYIAEVGSQVEEYDWTAVASSLTIAGIDGARIVKERSRDVDGLDTMLELYVPEARVRRRVVDELEKRFFRRSLEEEQRQAQLLRAMIAGTSAMTRCAGLENIDHEAMGSEAREELLRLRRLHMREKAQAALVKFDALTPEERKLPKNQGALELYSDENQLRREELRSDDTIVKLLEKWWLAVTTVFRCAHQSTQEEKGDATRLSKGEYMHFHGRLKSLLEKAGDWDSTKTGPQEYAAISEADFNAYAKEGYVDREAFMQSVFELSDTWTVGVSVEEYEKFLRGGYDAMFGDLEDTDTPALPSDMADSFQWELIQDDGYGGDEINVDTIRWLDAPDLNDPSGPLDIFDATNIDILLPEADLLDLQSWFYRDATEDEKKDFFESDPPVRRRSSAASSTGQRRRRSSTAKADDVRGPTEVRRSSRRGSLSKPAAPQSTENKLPTSASSTDEDKHVVEPTTTAKTVSSPMTVAAVEASTTLTPPKKEQVQLCELVEQVRGKVVLISLEDALDVLARKIKRLEEMGAKAVLIQRAVIDDEEQTTTATKYVAPTLHDDGVLRVPIRHDVSIPVSTIDMTTYKTVTKHKKIRGKKMRLTHFKRSVTPMPMAQMVETVCAIYMAKMLDDQKRGEMARRPLKNFVQLHFRNQYGNSKMYSRKYRSFLFGLLRELDQRTADKDNDAHSFVSLFAQLCGVGTNTGRVVALPGSTADFVLDHLRFFDPLLTETNKIIPNASRSEVQKKMTGAKASRIVGAMQKSKVRQIVHRALTKYLELSKRSEVYKVAMAALSALQRSVKAHNGSDIAVLPCPAVLSLLAVTFVSCDCPGNFVIDEPETKPPPVVVAVETRRPSQQKGPVFR